jgi:hypothetical protein
VVLRQVIRVGERASRLHQHAGAALPHSRLDAPHTYRPMLLGDQVVAPSMGRCLRAPSASHEGRRPRRLPGALPPRGVGSRRGRSSRGHTLVAGARVYSSGGHAPGDGVVVAGCGTRTSEDQPIALRRMVSLLATPMVHRAESPAVECGLGPRTPPLNGPVMGNGPPPRSVARGSPRSSCRRSRPIMGKAFQGAASRHHWHGFPRSLWLACGAEICSHKRDGAGPCCERVP